MSKDHPHRLTGHIPTDAELPMIVVAGHLQVEPDGRASYLQGCRVVVGLARAADECLAFALSPDLLDPDRINVFERWQTLAAVEAFRGSGPSGHQTAQILNADVHQFEVVSAETL